MRFGFAIILSLALWGVIILGGIKTKEILGDAERRSAEAYIVSGR